MQIVTVAPIVRGVLRERLSYFSKEPLEVGMVIIVPIRSREIPAIVLETKMASDEKSLLKSSDYAIRKITRAHPHRIWSNTFLKAIEETANLSAQKFGETLLALTPKVIIETHLAGELPSPENLFEKQQSPDISVFAIQGDTKTRLENFERLVRESFVRNESIFICLPTEDDVLRVGNMLGRGITEYTFTFHGSLTKKRTLERWEAVINEKHAVLVVGTAQYLGIPRYFKTIVLDEEHSRAWKTISRPLLDLHIFAESYARACGSKFILGAPLLRAETHERIREGKIEEFGRIAARTYSAIKTSIIDPRIEEKAIHEQTGKSTMVLFSSELHSLIEHALQAKESVLLITARKGLSPVTTCGDCGTIIRCPLCETPLVIHKRKSGQDEEHVYVCHACGFMRSPENNVHETCPQCGGWKLQGVGIGIDRVEVEIKKHFHKVPHFVLDGDHVKTRAQAKKLITQFQNTPGSILVATPMAIPLLGEVAHTAIVSIDALFAIPDIRMPERIFALILALREKTTISLLAQTRADDTTIFAQALNGDLSQFINNELVMRKAFFYPPFGTIIKITLRGKRTDVAAEMERLKVFLGNYSPIVSGSISKEPKNIFRIHLILKLSESAWPDHELLAKLRALPHQFTTEVNPDNLL